MGIELDQGIESIADMRAHRLFCRIGPSLDNGRRDQAVVGVGRGDALRGVETGEQQPIDWNGQAFQELGDVFIARSGDDKRMPSLVQTRETVMIARMLAVVEFLLN